jgi:hypothetical protein
VEMKDGKFRKLKQKNWWSFKQNSMRKSGQRNTK